MSAYVFYRDPTEKNIEKIEVNENSTYWLHFAKGIIDREGRHTDPVPGSGLDVEFARLDRRGRISIFVAGSKISEMILTDRSDGVDADVQFLKGHNQTMTTAATGILKACALVWAQRTTI